jgi:hypothetical protein
MTPVVTLVRFLAVQYQSVIFMALHELTLLNTLWLLVVLVAVETLAAVAVPVDLGTQAKAPLLGLVFQ